MRATGIWLGGFETELSDGRGHKVAVDLDPEEGGQDCGTSALELAVLSLAGCITTIFTLVARRRRLAFEAMRVDLSAERPPGARTITGVAGTMRVTTSADAAEVATALNLTLRTCPVGVIFERAQIPIRVEPLVEKPTGRVSRVPESQTASS
jgi:putative redox protein